MGWPNIYNFYPLSLLIGTHPLVSPKDYLRLCVRDSLAISRAFTNLYMSYKFWKRAAHMMCLVTFTDLVQHSTSLSQVKRKEHNGDEYDDI